MQLSIEKNRKEKKLHGDYAFPVHISEESIGSFEGNSFMWHWHPEIELTWIRSGEMVYQVNTEEYVLREGDGLFCNSSALHSGHRIGEENCEYLSVTFHPRLVYGYNGSLLQEKYTDRITSDSQWTSLPLYADTPWQKTIIKKLQEIYEHSKSPAVDYELEVHILLCQIWQLLFCHYMEQPKAQTQTTAHLERLKKIITYMQTHYAESITLEDIAGHANICKNECCRFFKKYMHLTLFDYLLFYRIQESLPLLRKGLSITSAAQQTGFSDSCYYSKIFRRYMNCTPTEYKRGSYEK
ncbi:MAG: AraC family transcriptional regulator [Lachnospiraceae bacterium]|nr:AraC family transcriptional regulator [Lachnospiraceae bacterium]